MQGCADRKSTRSRFRACAIVLRSRIEPRLAPWRVQRPRAGTRPGHAAETADPARTPSSAAAGGIRSSSAASEPFQQRISRCRARSPSRTRGGFRAAPIACSPRRRSGRGAGAWRNRRPPRASSTRSTGPRSRTCRLSDFQWNSSAPFVARIQFPSLLAVDIGVEHESALVEAFHQHHANIGQSIGVDGRQRHGAGVARLRSAASSNQAANSRNGSSASVKSPLVNQVGCLIGADSDMLRSIHGGGVGAKSLSRRSVIEEGHADGTRCRGACRRDLPAGVGARAAAAASPTSSTACSRKRTRPTSARLAAARDAQGSVRSRRPRAISPSPARP